MTNAQDTSPVILFVDDEAATAKYFQRAISTLAPVATAGSVEEGKRVLDAHSETLLVLVSDQRMPGEYGNELLRYAKERYPHIIRILATAYSELENTVEAINEGQIHRYLKKPLDLNSLRIELKQVLDFAYLRKERDHLVKEKLIVQHTQVISHRIGALHTICANVSNPALIHPLDTYLRATLAVGVKAPEPNWLLMDYSDLVSAEATRSGEFGFALRNKIAELEQSNKDGSNAAAIKLLSTLLSDKLQVVSEDTAILLDKPNLIEFLGEACTQPVSAQHISWLAFLIWFGNHGGTLALTPVDTGLQCRATKYDAAQSATPLATWIEQF